MVIYQNTLKKHNKLNILFLRLSSNSGSLVITIANNRPAAAISDANSRKHCLINRQSQLSRVHIFLHTCSPAVDLWHQLIEVYFEQHFVSVKNSNSCIKRFLHNLKFLLYFYKPVNNNTTVRCCYVFVIVRYYNKYLQCHHVCKNRLRVCSDQKWIIFITFVNSIYFTSSNPFLFFLLRFCQNSFKSCISLTDLFLSDELLVKVPL
ncbi:hypothetical protein AGLY_014783 [Aphis glycines]|uniref:Uncharacterized protein n=1 Tax=Aphis glycines TaxID=307491 RepID=A0A6G0T270_APHGL|nr:hypothetical protein AGLY_014783 [Aphis glycines]